MFCVNGANRKPARFYHAQHTMPATVADEPRKSPAYKRVGVHNEASIVADVVALGTQAAAARKWRVDRSTVARIVKRFKAMHPEAEVSKSREVVLAELQQDATRAIQAGLRADDDPYKSAAIGVQVMSRTHPAWQGGNQVVALQAVFTRVPADWREEYAIPGDSAPQLPTPSE